MSGGLSLISTVTLASAGTIDFSSIPQTYNDLVVVALVRGARLATTDTLLCTVNGDTSISNYGSQYVQGTGTTASANSSGDVGIPCGPIAANSASSGLASFVRVWLPGYTATTWQKVALIEAGAYVTTNSTMFVQSLVGAWNSSTAINRLTFRGATTANLAAGSTVRVYGLT